MFVSAIAHVAPRPGRCARAVVPASEGGLGWAGWAAGGCMASTCEDGLGGVLAPRVAAGGRRCPRRRCAGRATVTPAQLRVAAPGQGVQRAGCGTEPEQALELADVKNMVLYERGRKRKDGPLTAQQSPPTKRNPGYITAIRLTRPAHATRPRLPNHTHPTLPPHPSQQLHNPAHCLALHPTLSALPAAAPPTRLTGSTSGLNYLGPFYIGRSRKGVRREAADPLPRVRPDVEPRKHPEAGRRPVAL